MLAYVFWHVPRIDVDSRDYETAHHAFHEALWQARVPGLLAVRIRALPFVPWLDGKAPGYEDWHFLENSAALDRLNQAAVTQARELPHDRIAVLAANGTAGLYGLRSGTPIDAAVAYWLSKPAGMSYANFDRSLQPLIEQGCCLWGRRMTMGPTPEFCLQAPAEISPPYPAQAIRIQSKYSRGPD